MPSIRHFLERLDPAASDHPYLAFERLVFDCTAKEGARQEHQTKVIQQALRPALKEAYTAAFNRRYEALQGFIGGVEGSVTRCFSIKVQGRLAAGLGNASVLENGLSLNHTYGLPYLPGTGLKGMASSMAHLGLSDASWRRGVEKEGKWIGQGEDHKVLFGTMDTGAEDAAAGIMIFHDAWWDPAPDGNPETQLPFQPDVMTPHHQKYNLDGGDWPNDWERPNPVPYVTCGGTFRLALTGPPEWVDAAYEILKMAFQHLGFGAKTQIGYGRGELDRRESAEETQARETCERIATEAALAQKRLAEEAERERILAQRKARQQELDGKLIPTDSGRGIYRLVFGAYTLEGQRREALKTLASEGWEAIAEDAKKRKERGGRVLVSFCVEEGEPVLLSLTPNLPPD